MAAIYLKDAYYSVSISRQFKNSLHLNGKKNYTVLRVFQMVSLKKIREIKYGATRDFSF